LYDENLAHHLSFLSTAVKGQSLLLSTIKRPPITHPTLRSWQTPPNQKPIHASSVSNIMVAFRRWKIGAGSLFLSAGGRLCLPSVYSLVTPTVSKKASLTFPSDKKTLSIPTRLYQATKASSESPSTMNSRQKRVSKLQEWATDFAGIQFSTGNLAIQQIPDAGLGLIATKNVEPGSVLITVPTSIAMSVELPRGGPDDASVDKALVEDRSVFRSLPWYAQFALYLYKLDQISSIKGQEYDMRPWLNSLPRKFTTPLHWTQKQRNEWLQYPHMEESVERQEASLKDMYQKLQSCTTSKGSTMTWDDFVWGCETARSRAFSGGYTGAPFNPFIYAFTLVLVTAYIGLNLGTLEQAANGAALVFCASILRDFVLPKFFRNKKYVICPVIDMCNHNSITTTANVAYEFFGNAYSLSTTSTVAANSEIFISYGSRSNDQLLQYYGFVEKDNPHDVYVMPPLREWDIAALEKACGGPFGSGKLQKLDRAGLLGKSKEEAEKISTVVGNENFSEDDATSEGNPRGGVIVSRTAGVDPAVIQALRALVSTDQEWQEAGESIGNFAAKVNLENERKARLAARTALEIELASKSTTLEEDREVLKQLSSSQLSAEEEEERTSLFFRIEKKKLLKETIDKLQ
jgi:hypothetical protein